MKIKKLKKLSQKLSIFIMVFALSSASTLPVYAHIMDHIYYQCGDIGADQNLSINVSSYLEIEKASGSVTNAVVNIDSPTSVTISTPIAVSYNVNSTGFAKVSVSATVPVSDGNGTVNALYGTSSNAMTIVFTRSNASATSSAVTNASSSSPSASSNINAVAFTFTPETPTATVGTAPNVSIEDNALLYSVNTGSFNLPFKVDGSSLAGTYSMDDAKGEYKATLTVSQVDV